jgi:hypothetical protein
LLVRLMLYSYSAPASCRLGTEKTTSI